MFYAFSQVVSENPVCGPSRVSLQEESQALEVVTDSSALLDVVWQGWEYKQDPTLSCITFKLRAIWELC